MKNQSKRRLRFLGIFAVLFTVLWLLWNTPFVYPVKLFVVFMHEISHGLAAVATGGEIRAIAIVPEEGGWCECPGGNAFLSLSAGYLGSLLWGGAMIWSAERFPSRAPWFSAALAALLGTITLLFVERGFATFFGLAFAALLLVLARRARPAVNRMVLAMLGLTSCLYAVLDIKSDILDRPELRSDASMLSELTPLSTEMWGVVWITAALLFCAALFRWLWKRA